MMQGVQLVQRLHLRLVAGNDELRKVGRVKRRRRKRVQQKQARDRRDALGEDRLFDVWVSFIRGENHHKYDAGFHG